MPVENNFHTVSPICRAASRFIHSSFVPLFFLLVILPDWRPFQSGNLAAVVILVGRYYTRSFPRLLQFLSQDT